MSRTFGIEIECEGMNTSQAVELLIANGINVRNSTGYTHEVMSQWKVVHDSSVPNGCEVVSPPLEGQAGLDEVKRVINILNDAGCYVTRKCGMHVHVQISDLTPTHVANIYNRYRKHQTSIEAFMPRSRHNSSYAKRLNSDLRVLPTVAATCGQQGDRFMYVNLCSFVKYGTMEFRQHQGTLNSAKATNWIKFLLGFVAASEVPQAAPQAAPAAPQTVQVPAVTRTTIPNSLRGNARRVLQLLLDNCSAGCSAEYLAQSCESTVPSIQSCISRSLRRIDGIEIVRNRRGHYQARVRMVELPVRPAARESVSRVSTDNLWRGMRDLQTYYARRVQEMGAQA